MSGDTESGVIWNFITKTRPATHNHKVSSFEQYILLFTTLMSDKSWDYSGEIYASINIVMCACSGMENANFSKFLKIFFFLCVLVGCGGNGSFIGQFFHLTVFFFFHLLFLFSSWVHLHIWRLLHLSYIWSIILLTKKTYLLCKANVFWSNHVK